MNKTYDGTTAASVTTSDDRVAGDTLAISRTATFGDKNVAYDVNGNVTGKTVSVSGVTLSGSDAANYVVASTGSTSASITPRTLTVAYSGVNKTYDGYATATVTTSDNRVNGDVLTVNDTATFSDKNVGAGKTVSVSGVTLSGTDAANYSVASTGSTTASITSRTLTVTYGGVNKVYNGSAAATVTTSDDRVTGDVLTVNDTAAFSDKNVAYDVNGNVTSKTVNVSGVSLSGTDAANYSVAATGSSSATITPRTLSVSYVGVNKVYDGGLSATVTTVDNRVSGDVLTVNDSASFRDKNAGSAKPVDVSGVTLSGTDAGNYTVASTGLSSATITPRTLTVTYTGVDKTYDGGTTASVTTSDDRLTVNSVADNLTISRTAAFSDKNVAYDVNGNVTAKTVSVSGVSLSGTDALNYSVASSGSTTARITPLTLTVTYNGIDKVYDGSTTASVTTTDNRLTNDVLSVVRTANFDTKNVGTAKSIAVTGVSLTGTDAGNYSVASTGSTSASVSRLPSVAWTGGVNGNASDDWLDPSNWAGGAVPDLANVAAVSIPSGVTVNFNTTAHGLAQSGTVQIDSLSAAGATLNQSAGSLQVAAGLSLGTLSQSAGSLTVGNNAVLGSFAQSGGTVSVGGDVSTTTGFVQGTSGSLTAAGAVHIGASHAVVLGQLNSSEGLSVATTGGSITQAGGTRLQSLGGSVTTLSAQNGEADADIVLGAANNQIAGPIDVTHAAALTLNGSGANGAGLWLRNIQSSGAQTYPGAVSFNTDTVISGNGIVFQGALDASGSVILHDSGNTILLGAIGSVTAPTHFEVDNPGHTTTLSGGLVRSSGPASIIFGGDVVVTQDTLFDSSNNGALPTGANISIAGKLNGSTAGGQSVAFNAGTGGAVSVGGAVGDVAALNVLTLTNAASFSFAGGLHAASLVTTAQPYSVAITGSSNGVTAATSFLNTGALTLGAAANDSLAFAGGLTATAPSSVTLAGTVQTSNAPIVLGGANVPVVLAANTVLSAGSGAVTLGGTVDGTGVGAQSLTVNSTGATTFGGAVGASVALSAVSTDAGGTVAINGGSVTTTGAQTYGDAMTLGANTVFSSVGVNGGAGGAISFGSTVDGASVGGQSLTVNTSGATTFGGAVGGSHALASVTTDAGGTVAVNGGGVTTTGAQSYGEAMTLGANTTFASVNGNAVGTGAITFVNTVDGSSVGAQSLTVNTSGATSFNGAVGASVALASVSTDAGGTVAVNGGRVTTTGAQTYGDAMTLGANTVFSSTGLNGGAGGAIGFGSTVDGASAGAQSLTVNTSGATTFGGAVGAAVALASVSTDAGGTVAVNGGRVTTTGAQTYGDAMTLGANTVFNSTGVNGGAGGAITFASTVDGASAGGQSLTVNTTGATTFNGAVGGTTALSSVSTDASGTVAVNGSSVTTTGAQTYGDAITLGANTVFNSTGVNGGAGGTISFASTLDGSSVGGQSLMVNTSGATTFGGAVGGTTALRSVSTNAGGTVAVNGGSVTTTGAQTYGDAMTLGANTTLTSTGVVNVNGGAINFASTVDGASAGAQSLTVNTTGATTFGGVVGGLHALASVTTDAGGTVAINGGAVTTTGEQNYLDAVTLGMSTLLRASRIGFASITASAAQIDLDLIAQTDETLGNVSLLGNLQVSSGAGGVQGGVSQAVGSALSVGGTATFIADGTAHQVAALTASGNSFGGLLTLDQANGGSWADMSVTTASALHLAPLQSAGSVTLQTQGALTADGIAASNNLSIASHGGAVALGQTLVSGDVAVQTGGGNLSQTGQMTVSGNTSLDASDPNGGPAGDIFLSNPLNTFAGTLALQGHATAVATNGDLNLANVHNTGSMTLISNGQLNLGSAFITDGDLTLQSQGDMTLGTAQISGSLAMNSAAGNVSFGAATVGGNLSTSTQGGTVDLGSATVGGGLVVQSHGGNVTQSPSGVLNVAGTSQLDAGTGSVVLTNAANQFGGAVALDASSAQLTAATNLTLGASTVTGALSVQSVAGSIAQTAPLTVGGTASLQAPQGSVTLSQSTNVFSQPLTLDAVNATVASAQALDLAASSVSGNLQVQVAQGNLTQSGALTVGGTSQLNVTGGDVVLTDAQNQFGGAMGVTTSGSLTLGSGAALTLGTVDVGGNAIVQNQGAVDLGTGTYHGKLNVTTAGGALTQSGPIAFRSDVDFDAGSGKIDLFDPKNLWTGALLFQGGVVMINHPALLAANTNAASLNTQTEVQVKVAPAADGTGGSTTPAPAQATAPAHGEAVISVSVDKAASVSQPGRVTVTVAADVSLTGRGFRFALGADALVAPSGEGAPPVKVSQLDGRPLPDWLKFDPASHTFSSDSVPSGAFPIQVKLNAGGVETVLVIQEQGR